MFVASSVPIVINPVGLPTEPKVIHVPVFALVVPFKDIEVPVKFNGLQAVIFAALHLLREYRLLLLNHLLSS